jgi:uncharacterized repeat protein (TIGR03806 family)
VKKIATLLLLAVAVLISCTKDPVADVAPVAVADGEEKVVFDPAQVPYPTLSTYRFFKLPMRAQVPVATVLPYAPITSLFTDYAEKARFVWMPAGVKATYDGDGNVLQFPESSVLIKNFYYDGVQPGNTRRIIETRILFKRNGQWEFADYVWNAEQTEAFLDMAGSTTPLTWTDANGVTRSIQYRIPSAGECQMCHKIGNDPVPIGPKPQNLNAEYAFADGVRNQLKKWVEHGFLEPGYPKNIMTTVAWDDPTEPLALRARSYLDANCAHCHAPDRQCSYRAIRFQYNNNGSASNQGICMEPEEPIDPSVTYNIAPGNVARSMVHFRMSSNDEAVGMPLIGTSLVHAEGLVLIEQYINSLNQTCN